MQLSFDFANEFPAEEQLKLATRIEKHTAPEYVPGKGIPVFQLAPRRAQTFSPTEMRERVERLKRAGELPPLKDVLAVFAQALDANFLRSVGIAPEED